MGFLHYDSMRPSNQNAAVATANKIGAGLLPAKAPEVCRQFIPVPLSLICHSRAARSDLNMFFGVTQVVNLSAVSMAQQTNGKDCGVYSLMVAESVVNHHNAHIFLTTCDRFTVHALCLRNTQVEALISYFGETGALPTAAVATTLVEDLTAKITPDQIQEKRQEIFQEVFRRAKR